jgi:hypothetical protein
VDHDHKRKARRAAGQEQLLYLIKRVFAVNLQAAGGSLFNPRGAQMAYLCDAIACGNLCPREHTDHLLPFYRIMWPRGAELIWAFLDETDKERHDYDRPSPTV